VSAYDAETARAVDHLAGRSGQADVVDVHPSVRLVVV
jgi:hypothetical protein